MTRMEEVAGIPLAGTLVTLPAAGDKGNKMWRNRTCSCPVIHAFIHFEIFKKAYLVTLRELIVMEVRNNPSQLPGRLMHDVWHCV